MARTSTAQLPVIPASVTRMGKNELVAYGRKGNEEIAGLEMLRRLRGRIAKGKSISAAKVALVESATTPASTRKAAQALYALADTRLRKQVANSRKA